MSIELRDERSVPIFIHSAVDDMTTLSPNAFRVYAHLSRRAGSNNRAWPSYQTMGDHCFSTVYSNADVRKRHAIAAVKELIEAGLIRKAERKNALKQLTNLYVLCDVPTRSRGDCAVTPPVSPQSPKGTPIEETTSDASHPSLGLFDSEQHDHANTGADEATTQAELLPVPVVEKPKDNACVKAYREFVGRYPNKAQMKLITEKNPDLENWDRAMRAWIGRGYNPGNVATMLEWSLDPSLMDVKFAGKGKGSNDPYGGVTWAEAFAEQENRDD